MRDGRTAWARSGAAMLAGALVAGSAQALCLSPACSCTATTGNVAFGNINPLSSSATYSTGYVSVRCSGLAGVLIPYQIDLGKGGGSYGARRMSNGGGPLAYNLYTDNTYAIVWGDGSGGSQSVSSGIVLEVAGLSPPNIHTVYGRVPGSQTTVVPGTGYTDTITVLVTYY